MPIDSDPQVSQHVASADSDYLNIAKFNLDCQGPPTWQWSIEVDGSADVFLDHFESFPVVPGVLQLRWLFELCTPFLPTFSGYDVSALKFKAPMLAGKVYRLTTELDGRILNFKFVQEKQIVSSGKFAFKP